MAATVESGGSEGVPTGYIQQHSTHFLQLSTDTVVLLYNRYIILILLIIVKINVTIVIVGIFGMHGPYLNSSTYQLFNADSIEKRLLPVQPSGASSPTSGTPSPIDDTFPPTSAGLIAFCILWSFMLEGYHASCR